MRNVRVLPLVLVLFAASSLSFAQTPRGPEFPVSVETQGAQRFPRVAINARGEFVVSWVSMDSQSSEGLSLFVRRFEADGTPATGDIQVSAQGLGTFEPAALAMMEDGSFVVVRPTARGLQARRYAPDGTPMGRDIVVTRRMGPQFRVASRGGGGFVVAWEGPPSIRARAFGADGEPLGPELVADRTGSSPELAVGPDGELVVVWAEPVLTGTPGEPESVVRAQRFAADGRRQGRVLAVSPKNTRLVRYDVAKDADGDFLVVWAQDSLRRGSGTFGRWYAQGGTPRPGVIPQLLDKPLPIELAMDARGNFVLTWQDFAVLSQLDVFGQRFTSGERPFRPVFRANTITSGDQEAPNVASDAAGNFVLVWEGPDEHGSVDVLARLFRRR